ncbi:MAG: DUF4056 domain-containing protein [Myxococcota bacterium]
MGFAVLGVAFAVASTARAADPELRFPRAAQQANLLDDPERRARPCLCQFGVGLRSGVPGFQIEQLLPPAALGHHSYGVPSSDEVNGQVYTCDAGFIDSTHLRAGADWTAHLALLFDRTRDGGTVEFAPEGGGVRLVIRRATHPLSAEDLLRLAQRAAYERLLWHEVMSWYYHPPEHLFSEQQSTFSPEDAVSDFVGTEVGRRALARVEAFGVPYEDAVDSVLDDRLTELGVVATADDTRQNFLAVDRNEDGLVTGAAWYDSDVIFWDQTYLRKRDVSVFGKVAAWRVPAGAEAGCDRSARAYVGRVPRVTERGTALTDLYEWQFTPERRFFRTAEDRPGDPRFLHDPLPTTVTNLTLPAAVDQVAAELRAALGPTFDQP